MLIPPVPAQHMVQVYVLGGVAAWRPRHRHQYTSPEISAETNWEFSGGLLPSSNPSSGVAQATTQSSKSAARIIPAGDDKKWGAINSGSRRSLTSRP